MVKWEVLSQFCNVTSVLYFVHTNTCRKIATRADTEISNLHPSVNTENLWVKYYKNKKTNGILAWDFQVPEVRRKIVLGLYLGRGQSLRSVASSWDSTQGLGVVEVMGCFLKGQKTWPEVCIILESGIEVLGIISWRVMLSVKKLEKPFLVWESTQKLAVFWGLWQLGGKRHLKTWNSQLGCACIKLSIFYNAINSYTNN